jgi:hypothetical protein
MSNISFALFYAIWGLHKISDTAKRKEKTVQRQGAYDMFVFTCSEALANLLGIHFIEPTAVIQSPKLLKSILK